MLKHSRQRQKPNDNGMSTGQIVVLSIIGGLIVIGGGTVGVMAVKKKKK